MIYECHNNFGLEICAMLMCWN